MAVFAALSQFRSSMPASFRPRRGTSLRSTITRTLHHNALLVERDGGWSAFFAGDSFTPSGIDDYCLQDRNFLHEGQGFFRCLDRLEILPAGCLILNQHFGQ